MDKRWFLPIALAAVLVVGVAAGLVGGAGSGGHAIAGTATASAVRPVPVVGDCLMGGPDGPFPFDDDKGEPITAPYAGWLGTCDGVRYGEVTAVLDGRADEVEADGYLSGQLQVDCDTALADYVGAPDAPADFSWWAAFADGSIAVKPDPRQTAAGQDWAACLIRPPYWGPNGAQGQVGVDGYTTVGADSIRNGWDDIDVRNRLGSCYRSDGADGDLPIFCGDPHDVETLAWTSGDAEFSAQRLIDSCRVVASVIIGHNDPTLSGQVTIVASVVDAKGDVVAVTPDTTLTADDRIDCDARPASDGLVLTSTLAGLAGGAAPLEPR